MSEYSSDSTHLSVLIEQTTIQIQQLKQLNTDLHDLFQATVQDELTINELLVLAVLFTGQQQGVQPSQIAQQLTLTLSTTSIIVTALLQKNLIKAEKSPADRRNIFLSLTTTGQQVSQHAWPALSQLVTGFIRQHTLVE